jgi:hypothetical protein
MPDSIEFLQSIPIGAVDCEECGGGGYCHDGDCSFRCGCMPPFGGNLFEHGRRDGKPVSPSEAEERHRRGKELAALAAKHAQEYLRLYGEL